MREMLIGRWRMIPVILISFLGVLLSGLLSWLYFDFSYFEPDTVSYLFQAKLFAKGKLCLPAPPEYGFSSSPHINILNGKWYSKYPFGNALMLTLGVLVNAPWLIPAIVTGLTLWILCLIVGESYSWKVALLAAILGLISPATLGMGATWFSEPVSRFYLALFLLGLLKMVKKSEPLYAALSGFALGYAFNTRPAPAVAFGICGGAFLLYHLIRTTGKVNLMRLIAVFLIPFSLMIGLTMAWNRYFTGNPFKFTHNAAQPYDRMGFGRRTEGYDPDLEHAFLFTPKWALERIWRHTIPCVSFNTLGWGYYRPSLFRSFRRYTDSIVVGLLVKSPKDNDWVTVKLWGHGDGAGQIQFQRRGLEEGGGLTGKAEGFHPSGGKVELWMRLVKDGDKYAGYFKSKRDEAWQKLGPVHLKLTPPYEIGIYAGVCTPRGRMEVDFDRFAVNDDSSGKLEPDEFNGEISPRWRWQRQPRRWSLKRREGWLHMEAERNANLFIEDTASRLYQVTSAERFDVETHFVADWYDGEKFLILRVIPLAFPIILMLIPLAHRSRNRYDLLFFSLFLMTLFIYFFFYFEGSTWGFTPVNARYYAECTLLGIIPLTARGMFITYGCLKSLARRMPRWGRMAGGAVIILALCALTINTVHSYILFAQPFRNWSGVYQVLPMLVKERKIHNAVVFIPHTRDAPIGDYPFKSLEKADIVYFKLGPSKVWRLTNSDWKRVYKKYFKGRRAYIYEGGRLKELNVASL